MNNFLKYFILCGVVIVTCLFLFLAWQNNHKRNSELTCCGLKIDICDNYNFVTSEEVKSYIDKDYGSYIGQRVSKVNLVKIERIINSKSNILKSEAYITNDGYLNIIVKQREPIVRFQNSKEGFYSDQNGFLFPLQRNYTSLVPIIDGQIPINFKSGYKGKAESEKEKQWLDKILAMVNYMNKSKIWSQNISQITIGDNLEMTMIPQNGKEKFIFGDIEAYEEKFERIADYYRYILHEKGENYYSTVNVKYEGQIICSK